MVIHVMYINLRNVTLAVPSFSSNKLHEQSLAAPLHLHSIYEFLTLDIWLSIMAGILAGFPFT